MKKVLALLLTVAMLLGMFPAAFAASDPVVTMTADKTTIAVGETVTLTLGIDQAISNLNNYQLDVYFDSTAYELISYTVGDASTDTAVGSATTDKNGNAYVRVGGVNTLGDPVNVVAGTFATLTFTALTATEATFSLNNQLFIDYTTFEPYTVTMPAAVVVNEVPETHTVTLTEGEGYTIAAADGYNAAAASGEFKFTVTAAEGYEITEVKAGETVLSAVDGVYTISNITADVTVTVAAKEAKEEPAQTAPSTITTAAELKLLADEVNAGDDKAGKTYTLGNNIDLSEYANWTPIGQATVAEDGTLSLGTAFAGTFDGNNKTISGLSASNANGGVALFGYSTGTIQNLTVSGAVSGKYYVAGVVAVGQGTISGVTSNVTVTTGAEGLHAAGILADATGDVTITNCHNNGNISNGKAGSNVILAGKYGGIVGRVDSNINASITNCSNTGAIEAYHYAGGIIGGAFGNVTIQSCFNTGSLTTTSYGMTYLGGIAGKLGGGTIDSCYNWGTLNCQPWDAGHIRAVGGIAGTEMDHTVGTAITNCYNIGTINLSTEKMTYGSHWIYTTGGISGGNQKSAGNTMSYEDCFYLTGCIPSQAEDHADYRFWCDLWKSNAQAFDTATVQAKTADELKGADVLAALGSSFKAVEGGYPILSWQDGSAQTPTLQTYAIETSVTGGNATVSVAATAQEQSTVTFAITGIEEGKQIKSVAVTDASGASVVCTESEGTYNFTMPSRKVTIAVVLENAVAEEAESYAITLPTGLDAIWTLSVESTQYDAAAGTAQEGATVTVKVNKAVGALSTSFTGITVTGVSGAVEVTTGTTNSSGGVICYGEYTFTMPGEAVEVTLNAVYSDLKVYVKEGEAEAELTKTLTREDMVTLAGTNTATAYYSGWGRDTVPFIGVAEQYVTLTQLLTNAGITLEEGDSVTVSAPDGYSLSFDYELLTGERYYYADLLTNGVDATEASVFPVTLVIKGNVVTSADDLSTVVCDTLYAHRLVYGQSEGELANKTICVTNFPQCIVSLTVNKAEKASTGWDGTADTTWYDAANAQNEYIITTAAQLAGLAQLVDEGNSFAGVTFKLGNDIVLNEEGKTDNNWNPIGSASWTEKETTVPDTYHGGMTMIGAIADGGKPFAGTFDGQGYQVTGLYISSSDSGLGLFAYNTGTVKNLTVSGSIAKAGSDFVAGVVGANQGTVADVTSNVTISAGGSCNVGGVVGFNDGYFASPALVTRCKNNSSVTGYKGVAGIVGDNAGTVTYCVNHGAITSTNTNGKEGTGGIVGRGGNNGGAVTTSVIISCYNTGTIKGNKWVGGIAGFNDALSTVRGCYSIGKVTGYGSCNPIVGQNEGAASNNAGVFDCYSLKSLQVYDDTGVYGGYQVNCVLTDEDTLKAIPAALGGAFVAGGDMNNGYPVLFWEKGLTMGTITVDKNIAFGTVTCAATAATETNTVTVTAKAEKNYALKEGSLKYTTDGETYTELTATSTEGEYTFTMPKGDVTITAEFTYTGTYWDGTTIDTAWYNTTDTVFIINTPAELAGFAAIVNGTAEGIEKDDFSGKTVQLGTNIALGQDGLYEAVENVTYGGGGYNMTTTQYYLKKAAPVWTPIGFGSATSNTNASGNTFAGTFDGKGYTISGVYTGTKSATTGNTATVQGLFGIVTGTVKNVTVSGCITGKIVVGGIVAHLNGGTVQNCTNKAIIFADGGTTPAGNVENGVDRGGAVGGIVGNAMTGSTITKCVNNATVINANTCYGGRTGGIVGLIDGANDVVTVSKCGNTGNIETYQYGGGIVGMEYSKVATIDQCYNTGDIYGHGTQKIHFGGIVGTYTGTISNCYNTGTIIQTRTDSSKANYFGGIGGDYNYDLRSGTIINCYNLGEIVIKSTYGSHSAGMISGEGLTTTNCYYLGTLSTSKMGGTHGTAKTEAELKAAEFLTAINVDNMGAFVADDSTAPINNGYPVLGWQLGAAEPIPVSTKSEGEFKFEYIENQKFSIGTFKIYTVYNNDSTTELKAYEVYLGDTKIDTAAYTFTMDDIGKTLKVTWTANGNETNFVEKTLVIKEDYMTSLNGWSGSPKLSIYFDGENLDISSVTSVRRYMASGGYVTVEGEELATAAWRLEKDGQVVAENALTAVLSVEKHNGASLIMSYTYKEVTIEKNWGTLTILEDKDTNAAGYYELSTADDVVWFSAKVASGATDINAILMDDIDLTGVSLSTMSDYAGIFDGNGKTLTVKAALFNSVSTGTVKNLTVTGSISGSTKGGIVNTINGAATIENCVNKAAVSCSANYGGTVGGIVGAITTNAAGAKITKCVNEGTISITGLYSTKAGGIAANVDCADVEISQCVNAGVVKVNAIYATTAGGIAAVSKANITDCYNTAAVSASGIRGSTAGGIVGSNSGTIANCYNIGSAAVYSAPVGSIAASNSGTITNSYALTGTNGVLANGSGTVTDSAFKTSDELKITDLGDAWVLHGSAEVNSGYPILAWQRAGVLSDWTVSITDGVDGTAIVTPGTNVTMQVKVSGKAFNAVEADVTYDASVFAYVGCTAQATDMTVTQAEGKICLVLQSNTAFADGTSIATLVFQANQELVTGTGVFGIENPVVLDTNAYLGKLPAALSGDSVKIAAAYDVTLPEDGSLTGPTTANAGEDYTGQIANYDGANYDYTISVNGEKVSADIDEEGTFTIAAADITGDAALTVTKTLKGMTVDVVADFVNGYSMILVEKAEDNTSTTGYTYDGNAMYYVEAYKAYAWIVEGAIAEEDAAVLVGVNTGDVVSIEEGYNVNTVDGVDFADATTAFFCVNVNDAYTIPAMIAYYLRADVNADRVVDSDDVADIMYSENYNK